MKYKLIKSSQVKEFDKGFIKVKQLLSDESVKNLSVSIVEINGTNKKVINPKSDAAYFVIEGKGSFNIDGEELSVESGDLIFIPRGSVYFDKGNLKMLAINSPKYDQSAIQYLD